MIFNNYKQAFTLAEVLITLAIIGVIASLTIPALMTQNKNQEKVIKLKKTYATISQALKMSKIDNGSFETWDWTTTSVNGYDYLGSDLDSQNYYIPDNIIATHITPYFSTIKTSYNGAKMTLADGIEVFAQRSVYKNYYGSITPVIDQGGYSVGFRVDINGDKMPNIEGDDRFFFYLRPNFGLRGKGDSYTRAQLLAGTMPLKCTAVSGNGCIGLIMLDNWQIPDDYPR